MKKRNFNQSGFVVVLKISYDNFWFDFTVIWHFNDQNLLNSNMYCKILFFLTKRISLQLLWSKDFVAKTLNVPVHLHQLLLTKIILLQILWDELSLSLSPVYSNRTLILMLLGQKSFTCKYRSLKYFDLNYWSRPNSQHLDDFYILDLCAEAIEAGLLRKWFSCPHASLSLSMLARV